MKRDKLSEYLKEFLLESKGRNALLYDQASKLTRLMKRDFANYKTPKGGGLSFESFPGTKDLVNFLKPYLPFRWNIQSAHYHYFEIHKFDRDGNVIEVVYHFHNSHEIVKLKKPLDLFGYYLNLRTKGYAPLIYYVLGCKYGNESFISEETEKFATEFWNLLKSSENTGDELSRDDVTFGAFDTLDPDKSYKYCWDEDYVNDNNEVRTVKKCEYKLPGNKRISQREIKEQVNQSPEVCTEEDYLRMEKEFNQTLSSVGLKQNPDIDFNKPIQIPSNLGGDQKMKLRDIIQKMEKMDKNQLKNLIKELLTKKNQPITEGSSDLGPILTTLGVGAAVWLLAGPMLAFLISAAIILLARRIFRGPCASRGRRRGTFRRR